MSTQLRSSYDGIFNIVKSGRILDVIEKLYNYYFSKVYKGHEPPSVIELYQDTITFELLQFLGRNKSRLKQDNESLNKVYKFFDKIVLQAKINTYNTRKEIYLTWKMRNYIPMINISRQFVISNYLIKTYNQNEEIEVRHMLGFTENLKELKRRLRKLNNEIR